MYILPDGYWNKIEKWYKNYSSCEDVALSDRLQRLVDGQWDNVTDMQDLITEHPNPKDTLTELNTALYIQALEDRVGALEGKLRDWGSVVDKALLDSL